MKKSAPQEPQPRNKYEWLVRCLKFQSAETVDWGRTCNQLNDGGGKKPILYYSNGFPWNFCETLSKAIYFESLFLIYKNEGDWTKPMVLNHFSHRAKKKMKTHEGQWSQVATLPGTKSRNTTCDFIPFPWNHPHQRKHTGMQVHECEWIRIMWLQVTHLTLWYCENR